MSQIADKRALPRVTASQVIRAMQKMGFTLSRQSGSHGTYHNSEGRRITVPQHPARCENRTW